MDLATSGLMVSKIRCGRPDGRRDKAVGEAIKRDTLIIILNSLIYV